MVHFGHFGISKGVILRVFVFIFRFFNILVILTGKIKFFDKKIP